ncbi:26S proteasome regulatory subunit N9, partial [Phenoliferia sp. Uapishka_3]
MDVDRDPVTYLATALSSPGLPSELKPFYEAFSRFYDNKLWYQLTTTIEAFLATEAAGPYQIDLYEHFIKDFASKLNQLKLASIGIAVARQFTGRSEQLLLLANPTYLPVCPIPDGNKALEFLTTLTESLDTPKTREAYVLATMESAHFKLLLGNNEGTKEAMDKCEKILDSLDSVDLAVHASFYRVSGDYFKAKAEYADYYKSSLLYLACVNVEMDLLPGDRIQRAHDLGLAALLGKIYNFGELLMHPILESLVSTPHAWIRDLLYAFNAGDIVTFDSLVPAFAQEPILQENFSFLRQKICLMALIEAVFKRPTSDRVLPFSVIASETRISADEVEILVMKALSYVHHVASLALLLTLELSLLRLKLIRGTIDQVSSTTSISWVQPRVLDRQQIDGLRERLATWCDRVSLVGDMAQAQGGPELFVQG